MKIKYNKEADVIYIQISNAKIAESDRNDKGIILDYDASGKIVGIEIIQASHIIKNPGNIKYEVA